MAKPNGQTQNLDSRIADALSQDKLGLPELRALLKEAEDARVTAQKIIDVESRHILDPTNRDPDMSESRLRRANRTIDRLGQAIPALQARVRHLELVEYRQEWNCCADELQKQTKELAVELREIYPSFLATIAELYSDIDRLETAVQQLHARAPIGEARRLLATELQARELPYFDAVHPPLRTHLKLPFWERSRDIAFPPDPTYEWNQRALMANEAMAERMRQKYATAGSAAWSEAQELQIKQQETEHAARDAELEAKRAAEKAKYEAALRAGK